MQGIISGRPLQGASPVAMALCIAFGVGWNAKWALAVEPNEPVVAAASDDGERALSRIKVPAGLKLQLWAAEPLLANPVPFSIDERGRIYVAETFRQRKGVDDNRRP